MSPPANADKALSATPQELANSSESAWGRRGDRTSLEQAIAAIESSESLESTALTRLARAYHLLATEYLQEPGANERRLAALEQGVLAGSRALRHASSVLQAHLSEGALLEEALSSLEPAALPAAFWYVANLARYVVSAGVRPTLLFHQRIAKLLERIIALDEGMLRGGPHRLLGGFLAQAAPAAGGDLDAARHHFERALSLGPHCFVNRVDYAELYAVHAGNRELFARLLGTVVGAQLQGDPDLLPEQTLAQRRARRLLERIDEFIP